MGNPQQKPVDPEILAVITLALSEWLDAREKDMRSLGAPGTGAHAITEKLEHIFLREKRSQFRKGSKFALQFLSEDSTLDFNATLDKKISEIK